MLAVGLYNCRQMGVQASMLSRAWLLLAEISQ